jgi:hypothetical protein
MRLSDLDLNAMLHPGEDFLGQYRERRTRWQCDLQTAVRERKQTEWMFADLVAHGGPLIISGQAKMAGKSLLTMGMSLCAALGAPFLKRGVRNGKPQRVVYANIEDGPGRIGQRLWQFGVRDEVSLPWTRIAKREGLWDYLQALVADPCDLLVIDPLVELAQMFEVDENDAIQMAGLMRILREVSQAATCTIVVIHHFRKAGDRMRGSTALEGAVDGWWDVTRCEQQPQRRLIRGTLRDGPPFVLEVEIQIGDGGIRLVPVEEAIGEDAVEEHAEREEAAKKAEKVEDESDLLTEALQAVTAMLQSDEYRGMYPSIKVLRKRLSIREERVSAALHSLLREGLVVQGAGGKGWRWCGEDPITMAEQGRLRGGEEGVDGAGSDDHGCQAAPEGNAESTAPATSDKAEREKDA